MPKQADRLRKAFFRLTRDKYMPPKQFKDVAYQLAELACNCPGAGAKTLYQHFHAELLLGAYKGKAPFQPGTYAAIKFRNFLATLPKRKPINDARIELQILKLTIEEKRA